MFVQMWPKGDHFDKSYKPLILTVLIFELVNGIPSIVKNCKLSTIGSEYLGTLNVASSGRSCQRWDSQIPHEHPHNQSGMFPDVSVSEANNYCRNPDDDFNDGPWCYTVDPDVRRESCDVVQCHAYPECALTPTGAEYRGSLAITESGTDCLQWDSVSTTFENISEWDANYCRNPDGKPSGPWCFVADLVWEDCDVPMCSVASTCKNSSDGHEYAGSVSLTRYGRQCQNWHRQHPHTHPFTDPELFPDETIEDAENYCRNPDRKDGGPWCYTTDPNIPWEYCNISTCSDCTEECADVPLTRHVIHIGIDGLHPGCFPNASSGAPNILNRLAHEGSYTLKNARTVLSTWSAPGWTANLCAMSETSTGIMDNNWRPPWQGTTQPISPVTGTNVPLPCVFSQLKGLDVSTRTAAFYNWDWLRYHMNDGNTGVVDHEFYCDPVILEGGSITCDEAVTNETTRYLNDILVSAPKSYTYIYFLTVDNTGHTTTWCNEPYLRAVDFIDGEVGKILDAIDRLGLTDDVLVILSSDHGGERFGHGEERDADLLIPLIVRGPGVKKNFQFPNIVSNMDIVPTAVWALGYQPNRWWQGAVLTEAFY